MACESTVRDFEGIYELAEAARYLQVTTLCTASGYSVPSRKLIRWIRLGLSDPRLVDTPGRQLLIAFEDLVSLRAIAFFRARGVRFAAIREAERYLRSVTGYRRPFATESLWIESRGTTHIYARLGEILVAANLGGQIAFLDMVRNGLTNVHGMTFDERRVAASWQPRPHILLHPQIQFGRPCIAGTRIPTNAIAGMHSAGDTIDFLARSYGVREAQIRAAIDWERDIAAA